METISYSLSGVVPHSGTTGVDLRRLEMAKYERSPLAVVWYTITGEDIERGARIDLQKQVFLDDFGTIDRNSLSAAAKLIVRFVNSSVSKIQGEVALSAGSGATVRD